MVLFHHVYTRFPALFEGNAAAVQMTLSFISELNVQAVLFFFFLSGFSICLSLKNGLPLNKESFNEYVYRRLKRIMPLYYFAITFTLLCGLLIHTVSSDEDFSIKNLLGNIFFLQCSKSYKGNWFAPYGDNGPLWSLSFEMFYYFLLPVFLWLLLKLAKSVKFTQPLNRIALLAAFVISVAGVLLNQFFFFPFVAFAGLLYVWYAGFFAAWLYGQKSIALDKNFFLLLVLAIVFAVMNYTSPSATLGKLLFGGLIGVAFFLVFIIRKNLSVNFILVIENGFNFLFYKIGTGSYALYLLHYPVLMLLKKHEAVNLWQMALALILTTFACILLEQLFVKQKWLFLKRRYLK
jgi:peptidoglycan/LPS O-acetylase OafA/YrhL